MKWSANSPYPDQGKLPIIGNASRQTCDIHIEIKHHSKLSTTAVTIDKSHSEHRFIECSKTDRLTDLCVEACA